MNEASDHMPQRSKAPDIRGAHANVGRALDLERRAIQGQDPKLQSLIQTRQGLIQLISTDSEGAVVEEAVRAARAAIPEVTDQIRVARDQFEQHLVDTQNSHTPPDK